MIGSGSRKKLLGRGDYVVLTYGENKPVRVFRVAYISDDEVKSA